MAKAKLIFLIEAHQITLCCPNTWHTFAFDEHELVAGVVCNQTKIKNIIKDFLYQKKLHHLPGIVVFGNTLVHEQLAARVDLHGDLANKMYVNLKLNESLNYLAILEPGLFLQYQILFEQVGLYIELFTTMNLLHIKDWLDKAEADKSLNGLGSLEELYLMAKSKSSNADLYVKMVQAIEKINKI